MKIINMKVKNFKRPYDSTFLNLKPWKIFIYWFFSGLLSGFDTYEAETPLFSKNGQNQYIKF